MAKKKLLNEATVRRFMGLAGMESNLVSNKLTEMYGSKKMEEDYMEEDLYEEEGDLPPEADEKPELDGPEVDAGPKMDDEGDLDEPEVDMDDEPEMDDDVREISAEDVETLEQLADKLPDIVAKLAGEGGMMGDEPEMDDEAEVMEEDEVLEGVELELSEDEIVQEVAKRVAKRILKAKRAKAQLDEALGRSTKRTTK